MSIKSDTEDDIPEGVRQHIEKVRAWLKEHVLVYADVSAVTLHDFNIPDGSHSGTFKVSFGSEDCPQDFSFSIGGLQNGKVHYCCPIYHSPLGAPASYGAVEYPRNVGSAIENALNNIFPSIKPLGLDPETGEVTTMMSRWVDRVRDHEAMNAALDRAKAPGFEFTQPVEAV